MKAQNAALGTHSGLPHRTPGTTSPSGSGAIAGLDLRRCGSWVCIEDGLDYSLSFDFIRLMSSRKRESVEDTDHLATALDTARRKRGLSQAELANLLGTSQSTISKLLAAQQAPRPALRAAIVRFTRQGAGEDQSGQRELMPLVEATSRRSMAFRALLQAALNLAHENE